MSASRVAPEPFDLTGPLPVGTTLLEASAGTGKTWTIASLVTRFVAEGAARIEELLVITFTRAASQELRDRVRAQLVEAERALGSDPGEVTNAVLAEYLCDCSQPERASRRAHVATALASFDAATIATTHQFCSIVLDSLGVAGDTDPQARLVEDLGDLETEVIDDLYLRRFADVDPSGTDGPWLSYAEAAGIGLRALRDPQARLEAAVDDPDSLAGARVRFAVGVRDEMERRKRRSAKLSFDDLLSQLADALSGADSPAGQRMRARWSVVLVDEFQDTDPVQWEVLRRAFDSHTTMVLIGDPKQAIYAFRGGDVYTYLNARRVVTHESSLATNYRSDQALVTATGVLLQHAALGDAGITVRDVVAQHPDSRLARAPHPSPLRLRRVRPEHVGRTTRGTTPAKLAVGPVRDHIAADLAADIRTLLDSPATFDGRDVQAADVAVLSATHRELSTAQAALRNVGVPAVVAGGGSVFATEAALEWLRLLEALSAPHRRERVRSAAASCFVGLDLVALDEGGDELDDRLAEQMREWAQMAQRLGIAAVLEMATIDGMPARLVETVGGERLLTDVRHIGEVLYEEALAERMSISALTGWLAEQVARSDAPAAAERTRRLDSDAAAVQLVTIHASKGLQYPIVYLPTLWDRYLGKPSVPLFHAHTGTRCLHVGGPTGFGWDAAVDRWRQEEAGESLRLLYVAMTRAQSQVVTWWAPTANTAASPLHRMLFGRAPNESAVPDLYAVPAEHKVGEVLEGWRAAGAIDVADADVATLGSTAPPPPPVQVHARKWTRSIDTRWRRTSYTSLSRPSERHAASSVGIVTSEATEHLLADDEAEATDPVATATSSAQPERVGEPAPASPMAGLPRGAEFGSLVHAVLERVDHHGPDLHTRLVAEIGVQLPWWRVDLDPDELATALVAVCTTPLAPLTELSLADIPSADRLSELDFELPLAGGDHAVDLGSAGPPVLLGDLADLLERHLPRDDPLRAYAAELRQPALGDQELRGYLNGSIDAVLRITGDNGAEHRYVVVDYKTNSLGPPDEPQTAEHYEPSVLAEAMAGSSYPLQAMLYAVVGHRFLRGRLPDYDPHRHLAGVQYHYLRGMCGPATPVVDGRTCGVFTWQPPVELIEAISDLLDGAHDGVAR